jgi:Ni,Fe-hydrogenase I cytochrome b subunit
MRILYVWLTALSLMTFVSIGWYVSMPIVYGVANALRPSITMGSGPAIVGFVIIANISWGPIFDVVLLLWALISSQQKDVESEIYR